MVMGVFPPSLCLHVWVPEKDDSGQLCVISLLLAKVVNLPCSCYWPSNFVSLFLFFTIKWFYPILYQIHFNYFSTSININLNNLRFTDLPKQSHVMVLKLINGPWVLTRYKCFVKKRSWRKYFRMFAVIHNKRV